MNSRVLRYAFGATAAIALLALAFWPRSQTTVGSGGDVAVGGEESHEQPPVEIPSWVGTIGAYSPGFVGDLREPLDEEELRRLAANPGEDRFRLKVLICRASADKDERFQYLLNQEGLREDPWIDLPLAAYDFSVNGNRDAFDYILAKHAEERPGSDCDTVLVLSFVDEWQRSIRAVLDHFEGGTDGAAGIAYTEFWVTRKQLFPEQFRRAIEGG